MDRFFMDELTPSEAAAEPKWATFCSHLNGEWVGQYAAYTPWEGKPEPAWVDERGKYINVVYTRALEHRHKYTQQRAQPGPEPGRLAEGGAGGEGAGAAQQPQAAAEGPDADSESEGEVDVLLRKIGRCTRLAALANVRLPPEGRGTGWSGSEPDDLDSEVDVEALAFNSDGIVVFDGGNYSAGPEYIGGRIGGGRGGQQQVKIVDNLAIEDGGPEEGQGAAAERAEDGGAASAAARRDGRGAYNDEEDEDEEDEYGEDEDGPALTPSTTTSVFEQCLVDWGSRTRMRLKLTLRIGQLDNGEVDVEVLRILLFSEQWLGPASAESLSTPVEEVKLLQRPCTELPRPTPAQLQGSWNVFTVCATGMDEADPFTGEERVSWLYTAGEEQQLWDAPSGPPAGDEGGSYWLPGGVVLSLRMLDNYVPVDLDSDSDGSGSDSASAGPGSAASNGNGNGNNGNGKGPGAERTYPRGLCISLGWLWREGSASVVEREYDGYGYLREVRLSQAVKGGWSGGRM
ncbi:hypothetical protein GPECTOR_2g1080 [Gonium pectorale]|uniref:DUF3598 domain-containing protein n=1 Tax=Gonium pectorale TaxID=33097 RepID=A0A150H0B7_GONPE|nr:hypothetical protein GPECTOR_2g1080 [Gonium pectorale]|eukprot:KXZ55531.1 hypothetical protein GPECTOR_2g1080 [Gonium pectorale]